MLAKKKRNLSTVEKITRVVAVLMLIGTLGAIILQVALTAMNYKYTESGREFMPDFYFLNCNFFSITNHIGF